MRDTIHRWILYTLAPLAFGLFWTNIAFGPSDALIQPEAWSARALFLLLVIASSLTGLVYVTKMSFGSSQKAEGAARDLLIYGYLCTGPAMALALYALGAFLALDFAWPTLLSVTERIALTVLMSFLTGIGILLGGYVIPDELKAARDRRVSARYARDAAER